MYIIHAYSTHIQALTHALNVVLHTGAQDFVRNVRSICTPLRPAPACQTASASRAFILKLECSSASCVLPEPQVHLVAPVRTIVNVQQDITRRHLSSTSVASGAPARAIVPRVALPLRSAYAPRASVSPEIAIPDVLLHPMTFAE